VGEWVWYTSEEQKRRFREERRRLGRAALKAAATRAIQRRDERALGGVLSVRLAGYEEPRVPQLLELAEPYLPPWAVGGEMVLSTGATIHFHEIGAAGVVDVSPFSCMNAIVTEAIYPKLSREHDDFPVRLFYFDGTQTDLDRDAGIFLELARGYQRRSPRARRADGASAG
jgi:predicted nucleotide-binding protein (sugar kinase/HSP70/actin superfamily)